MSEIRDDVPVLSASGLCKVFDDGRLHLKVLDGVDIVAPVSADDTELLPRSDGAGEHLCRCHFSALFDKASLDITSDDLKG